MSSTEVVPLKIKYNGKLFVIDNFTKSSTVLDVRTKLYELTCVPPNNQKLIGLVVERGKVLSDDLTLEYLVIKPTTKIMLIGSTNEDITKIKENTEAKVPESIDDFDFKEEHLEQFQKPENLEKIERRSKTYKFTKIANFRPGKRLLVLDIDYTIFDHLTPAESVKLLIRPYLNEMLTRAYINYDIAIWSATSMTWILAKIGQMNLISQTVVNRVRQQQVDRASMAPSEEDAAVEGEAVEMPSIMSAEELEFNQDPFRICLLVDSGAMISVYLAEHGVKGVKPLAVLWNNFPQYGPHNTIMFDDVRRNFAMNPQTGLRIHSYRDAHINNSTDKELLYLADYLDLIAQREPDFTKLNHNRWSSYLEKHRYSLHKSTPLKRSVGESDPGQSSSTNAAATGEREDDSTPKRSNEEPL